MNYQIPLSKGRRIKTRRLVTVTCLVLGLACLSGCGRGGGGKSPADGDRPDDDKPTSNGEQPPAAAESLPTQQMPAQQVLDNMVAAYRTTPSYADAGKVHLVVEPDPRQISGSANFAVAMVRPNKLRMEVYQAMVVSDGKKFRAAGLDLADQVLELETPERVS